jgi:hypothetical protein
MVGWICIGHFFATNEAKKIKKKSKFFFLFLEMNVSETNESDHQNVGGFVAIVVIGLFCVYSSIWLFLKWWCNDRNPKDIVARISIPSPRKSIHV